MKHNKENEFPTLTLLYVSNNDNTKVGDMELALGIGEDCIREARMALASKTSHLNKDKYHVNFLEMRNATDIQPLRASKDIMTKRNRV